ncbi:hypothetical protein CDL15_Pgr026495 [Punica granatum]|uniref:IQ domain-containing protein IQM2-like n=1 Tax=Punica granatum TaxID=22663 RepID=A0A218WL74_PUNGR|nr:hypothetical protein CDL15_Pgr026495 [Punica granatum]
MRISFSCPLSEYIDVENNLEAILVKSVYFANEEAKTVVRSVSFGDRDSQPTIMKTSGNKMATEASVSFKKIEPETANSINTKLEEVQSPRSEELPILDPSNPKHNAAIKLQKVYKSFRTRRKLADCAVLVQQRWFPSSASVANAAIVDLAKFSADIQQIDPRHRYGHNLHFYYVKWLHSQSREPFFYWLDVGEGKEVNLVDKCSRLKLQQQCIKYLGPVERKAYEVSLEGGKLFYKQSGEPLHTMGEAGDVKWIFVLGTSKTMYVGRKKKGSFQHSSFLAGGAALAAGRLVVKDGILKAAWPHSGHYRPTAENFRDFLSFLQENDVDLTDVMLSPVDEGEHSLTRSGTCLRSNPSAEDLSGKFDSSEIGADNSADETRDSEEKETSPSTELRSPKPSRIQRFSEKLTNLEIPKRNELIESFESENPDLDSPVGGYETAEDAFASGHDDNRAENNLEERPPQMKQNSPRPESSSMQPRKWTTGAGPRIRYVRDYPPELQVRALEHVNLSPRSAGLSRSYFSPRSASRLSPVKLSSTVSETEHPWEGSVHCRPKSALSRSLPDWLPILSM